MMQITRQFDIVTMLRRSYRLIVNIEGKVVEEWAD